MPEDGIERLGFGDWEVRVIDGVLRVSGTDLGRKLEYTASKPTLFNKQVLERWWIDEKLNGFDIVLEQKQCKKGFGEVTVTEYWLTPQAAIRVTMEVRTNAAREVRQRVVESLQRLRTPTSEPEAVTALAMKAIGEQLVGTMSDVLKPLADMVERVHGVYIDRDRLLELRYLARLIVEKNEKTSARDIWKGLREHHNFRPGPTFSTVLRTKYDKVLISLEEQLQRATREREQKERRERKELERAQKEAQKARPKKDLAAVKPLEGGGKIIQLRKKS